MVRQRLASGSFSRSRRGATIVLALGALVILGIVIAALTTLVIAGTRDAVTAKAMNDAGSAAENAVATARADWDARAGSRAIRGDVSTATLGDINVRVGATLLPAGVVRLAAEASSMGAAVPAARARRTAQLYLRQRPPSLDVAAAMFAVGPTTIEAGAIVTGVAAVTPASCAVDATVGAGLMTDDLTHLAVDPAALVDGLPPVASGAEPAVASVMAALASLSGSSLTLSGPLASAVFGPLTDAGGCALDDAGLPAAINAGDPSGLSSCASYRPYVRISGDLVTPTGRGQGILRVDGDLRVTGDFHWTGLIVVAGAVEFGGPDVSVHGLLVASGGASTTHRVGDAATFIRSSCAVRLALIASARVTPLTGASWAGLP